ncbi:phosphotransferase family protein [Rhodococcus sp. JS3073]|uniref:phosphotransferase family protein n=1 Tax=Rhodococcus sp. JS3073 TaxID=3002901 RepID=UPI0022863231|nr:phosphotransferase family protein [Rhodococcus sp. JS3073]WAM19236.1 phosphotransferase family protein [Rhodococcus sp. JS3073]
MKEHREEVVGLPRASVDRWLRSAVGDRFDLAGWYAEPISGGLSNLTYRLRFQGQSVILRRPPLGGVLPSAHDMQREWTLLAALHHTHVPVPEPLALCCDDSVLGGTFYVMSDVAGAVLRTQEDTGALAAPQRQRLCAALVNAFSDLHALVPDEVGLGGFGRPNGFNERQVRRWGLQWQQSSRQELPDMDKLLTNLGGQIPSTNDVAIVHGDYRLDNMIVDLGQRDPHINAIVDWELSTLGDPLADLGLALTYWHDLDDQERALIPVALGVTAHPGFMSAADIAEHYSTVSGRNLDNLNFYLAMGAMKLAVILAGVDARFTDGHMAERSSLSLDEAVRVLVARGLRQLTT